jgi:hypothetical protein
MSMRNTIRHPRLQINRHHRASQQHLLAMSEPARKA